MLYDNPSRVSQAIRKLFQARVLQLLGNDQQKELTGVIGNDSYVSHFLNDKKAPNPTLDTLVKIAAHFGLTLSELFSGVDSRKNSSHGRADLMTDLSFILDTDDAALSGYMEVVLKDMAAKAQAVRKKRKKPG